MPSNEEQGNPDAGRRAARGGDEENPRPSGLSRVGRPLLVAGLVVSGLVVANARPAAAEDATVTATGTFTYIDDAGTQRPIKGALVELCDEDYPGCALMGTARTSNTGTYTVTGTGGDWFADRPDPRVRVIADGPAGYVQGGGGTYCFQSQPRDNIANGTTLSFGTLKTGDGVTCDARLATPTGEDGAWHVFSNMTEGSDFMKGYSATPVPKVKVLWPDGGSSSSYTPPWPGDNGTIRITQASTFNEATVMHEYGHHVLQHFGEQPAPDYNNGVCDDPGFFTIDAGHCFWQPEKGSIHWTEGWASYFSEVVTTSLGKNDTISGRVGSVESHPHPHADPSFDKIEGYTTAILWDLHDSPQDVHGPNGSRDRLAQGFRTQWDVLTNYDPDPVNTSHNRVTDIYEFWRGVATRAPALANRLSEIYDVNHIDDSARVQRADLTVPYLAEPPASVLRGDSFTVTDRTANIGYVQTGSSSTTRYHLSWDQTFGPGDVAVASRSAGNRLPGSELQGSATAAVPTNTSLGSYYLLACADGNAETFEMSEANNCRSSGSRIEVKPVPAIIPSVVSLNPVRVTGGTSSTGTVTLTGPAPAGGVTVTLTSSSSSATVPASVPVPADASSASFEVKTFPVGVDTWVTISASANGVTKSGTLTVAAPPAPASITLDPASVLGGASASGRVGLVSPAPPGGLWVSLSSSSPTAGVPASVFVPAGATSSAPFTIVTSRVSNDAAVTIGATGSGVTRSATLTVRAARISALSLDPDWVTAGDWTIGTVTLEAPAGPAGNVVSLSSSSARASLPASVTVPAGATTATFVVNTSYTTMSSEVTITGNTSGVTRAATLWISGAEPICGEYAC